VSDVRDYDVLVIGSGSGATIVDAALAQGLKVAWVDRGPLGGTCLNVGCIPSKMLIFGADRIVEIEEARKLGIRAEIVEVDFTAIMERMRRSVAHSVSGIREGIRTAADLDFFETEGHFVGERTLQVHETRLRAERVFVAAGARPFIPPIEGLDQVDYLTNESVFDLEERPESLLIVGGGYIAAEFGHFFAAVGTRVTIVQRNEWLVPEEEPEISELLAAKLSERMAVHTHTEVVRVRPDAEGIAVLGKDVLSGEKREFKAARILIAAGRRSNADLLQAEQGGMALDGQGYVQVNGYLETGADKTWAFGDITGRPMFTHLANKEVAIAWHNSVHDHRVEMDYRAVPHAVFTHPQIASVGLTEAEARRDRRVLVGRANYISVAKGQAMMEADGFAKAVVERESGAILGFHIIGPYAPILIQEAINAMATEGGVRSIYAGLHIHPALPELVPRTLGHLHAVE
jgi:dihydrolipoamide dehydrogenase